MTKSSAITITTESTGVDFLSAWLAHVQVPFAIDGDFPLSGTSEKKKRIEGDEE